MGIVSISFGTATAAVLALALVSARLERGSGPRTPVRRRDDIFCAWMQLAMWSLAIGLHDTASDELNELIFRIMAAAAGLVVIGLYETSPAGWKLLYALSFWLEEGIYFAYDWSHARSVGQVTVRNAELHLNLTYGAQLLLIASGPLIYVGRRTGRALLLRAFPAPRGRYPQGDTASKAQIDRIRARP